MRLSYHRLVRDASQAKEKCFMIHAHTKDVNLLREGPRRQREDEELRE